MLAINWEPTGTEADMEAPERVAHAAAGLAPAR